MRRNIARVLLAVIAATGATVVGSGTASAHGTVPAAAAAPLLTSTDPVGPPPGPPPDCKHHPSFPGCKKKPAGSSPAPKP
jgi:hypothetical protein